MNSNRTGSGVWSGRFVLGALVAALAAPIALGDSIWEHRTARMESVYRDSVAGEIGDSITIVITERNAFTMTSAREMDKKSETKLDASLTTTHNDGTVLNRFDPLKGQENNSRSFEGSSDYKLSRFFTDNITVTVVDRLPNGNMVIAGKAEREVAGEKSVTVLTGIVRPQDITRDNTVSSQRVACARVFYETDGPSRAFLDQGWLNKFFNVICPF